MDLQNHTMIFVAAFPLMWMLLRYSRRMCVCHGGGSTQCTLKMSSVELHSFVLKAGKYIKVELNFLFCFQKAKISTSLREGLCVQV